MYFVLCVRIGTLHASRLQGHVRTPPAPMHAPVSLAVMAVCARIARLAREMRVGEQGASTLIHLGG